MLLLLYYNKINVTLQLKNAIFWDMMLCGFCKNWLSEECIASIFRVERTREHAMCFSC
jgi:hypothetical protein